MLFDYSAQQQCSRGIGNPFVYSMFFMICVFFESIPSFDIFFQTPFFHDGKWLITIAFHEAWKLLFYSGPKVIIGIIGGSCLLFFLVSVFMMKRLFVLSIWQKSTLLVAISIGLIPLFVSLLKAITGVHIPVDLQLFGGKYEHIGFLKQLLVYGHLAGGRGFPAGHASGGFALISLYYLPVRRSWKRIFLGTGLSAGWLTGLYQMGRGEHFMSHTLTSMFIAFTIITFAAKKLRLQT